MLGMNKMAYIHIMSSSGKSEEEIKNFVDKYDEFINQYMIPLPDETNKL
jgi:flagellar capping protein FliD